MPFLMLLQSLVKVAFGQVNLTTRIYEIYFLCSLIIFYLQTNLRTELQYLKHQFQSTLHGLSPWRFE